MGSSKGRGIADHRLVSGCFVLVHSPWFPLTDGLRPPSSHASTSGRCYLNELLRLPAYRAKEILDPAIPTFALRFDSLIYILILAFFRLQRGGRGPLKSSINPPTNTKALDLTPSSAICGLLTFSLGTVAGLVHSLESPFRWVDSRPFTRIPFPTGGQPPIHRTLCAIDQLIHPIFLVHRPSSHRTGLRPTGPKRPLGKNIFRHPTPYTS